MADTPLPDLDPAEPITPELVLVSPELRERALASAPQFPNAVQHTAELPPDDPVPSVARPPRSRTLVLVAAAVILATGLTGAVLSPRFVGESLERLVKGGGGVARPKTTSIELPQLTTTGTAALETQPTGVTAGAARPPATRHLARRAERDVLNSPQFFLRLGIAGRRFVDPTTRLFRAQVSIRCSQAPGATHLSCTVRRGNESIVVLYVRGTAHSFRLLPP